MIVKVGITDGAQKINAQHGIPALPSSTTNARSQDLSSLAVLQSGCMTEETGDSQAACSWRPFKSSHSKANCPQHWLSMLPRNMAVFHV